MPTTGDLRASCPICNEATSAREPMHRVCVLRSVMGGIGHHLDHHHWCLVAEDPDAGMSAFDSALCVNVLVDRYGADGVIARSFPPMSLDEVRTMAGLPT